MNSNDLNFVLANARSLRPKLYSMIETLEQIQGHIAVITETWFGGGEALEQNLRDITDMTGYAFIRKDRCETGSSSRGGGVAIVYKKDSIEITQVKVEGNFEVVAALGRRTAQRRKIITCLLYTSPSPRDRQKSRMPSSA